MLIVVVDCCVKLCHSQILVMPRCALLEASNRKPAAVAVRLAASSKLVDLCSLLGFVARVTTTVMLDWWATLSVNAMPFC